MHPIPSLRERAALVVLALGGLLWIGGLSLHTAPAGAASQSVSGSRPEIGHADDVGNVGLPGVHGPERPHQDEPADETLLIYLPLQTNNASLSMLAPAVTPTPGQGTPAAPTAPPSPTFVPPTNTATQPPSATPLPTPSIVIDGDRVLTDHYELRVYTDRIDKQEFGRLLEAYYPQAVAHFGAEPTSDAPGGRLIGEVYHDAASYQAALARDGIDGGGSGGYYAPWLQKFYLFVQPSRHYTRQLTLHEASHQMQSQAGGCKLPGWWTEGEPEFLGMHTWDGTTLQTKVVPPISLEDYPAGALSKFLSKNLDFGDIVASDSGWIRKEGWGIIAFLFDTRPEQAEALRKRYCAGEKSAAAWEAVFGGPVDAAMNDAYHTWLLANQQPWEWVWNTFEPDGPDAFQAFSDSNAIAVLKEVPRKLEVDLSPTSEAFRAGIMYNYRGTSDFTMLRLNQARKLSVIRVEPGWNWSWEKTVDIPERADGALDTMRIEIEHPVTILFVNDQEVARYVEPAVAEGRVGLNLENSRLRFRVLDLQY